MRIVSTINSNANMNLNVNNAMTDGGIIKGKIISLEGKNVVISTPSGELIEAKLEGDLQLNKNIMLDFMVKYTNDGKVILTPLNSELLETNTDNLLKFILKENGVPENDKNLQIVKLLMDNKMPINKQTIEKALKYVDKLMQLSNISDNEKILMVLKNISTAQEDISNFIKVKDDDITQNLKEMPNQKEIDKEVVSGNKDTRQETVNKAKIDVKDVTTVVKNLMSEVKLSNENQNSSITKTVVLLLKMDLKVNLDNLKIFDEFVSNEKGFIENEIKEIVQLLDKEINAGKNIAENIEKNITKNLGKIINKNIENTPDKNIESDVNKILNKFVKSMKALTGQEDKKSIDDIIKNLNDLNKEVKNMIKDNSVIKATIEDKTRIIEQKINFISNMNDSFNLLYVPVELSFEDLKYRFGLLKKNKVNKAEEADFYISVHTRNLKKIDVVCKLTNKKIQIKFLAEDESITKLLNDNKSLLEKQLENQGFNRIELIAVNKLTSDSIFSNLLEKNEQKKYLLDVRV
ncbi:flagellar hook-length control protein FliK [Abyssisolibacter fermentans]|uniref:flagellar hook-length control protein FliK n=1 Tax=Abyssisolibacter fermentans TaxID=1766203 RepID=UPI000832AFB0|nr:flagellar hook-length control protein FliK [Abyssisolibacter fermentans]